MPEQNSFGNWLRLKRKALDLTREGLADQVCCSAATIRKLEAEERRPSAQIAGLLADIFQIPQGERTQFLRFARGDWQSAPAEPVRVQPWQTPTRVSQSNLPATITSQIGREEEIRKVCEFIRNPDIRLVTLIGTPGIGKTRLSIAAARAALPDFADGVFFVALAPLDNVGLLVHTLAQALGYGSVKNLFTKEQLIDSIGEKQMLLVLDNCEHLIAEVALLAAGLLTFCSRLKFLVTSRESLNASGERVFRVPPLQFPDLDPLSDLAMFEQFEAVRLFVDRAQAVQPGFAATGQNAPSVAQICQRLDGIPLAIELAAARLNVLNVQQLAVRLDQAFGLLTGGTRTALPRQQTLRATLDWSYQLLNDPEKVLLRRLSAFSGSFDLEAVEAVCGFGVLKAGDILDLLSALINKSLVIAEPDPLGGMRCHLLVILRQYANEKLFDAGEHQLLRDRHLDYYVMLTEQAEPFLKNAGRKEWTRRLKTDWGNIQEALDWADQSPAMVQKGLRMAVALGGWHFFLKGSYQGDVDYLHKGLALLEAQDLSPLLQVSVLNILAYKYMFLGNERNRMDCSAHCIRLCRAIGSPADIELCQALYHYSNSYAVITKNFAGGRVWQKESVQIARGMGPAGSFYLALALFSGSWLAEDPQQRYQDVLESYRLFKQSGERWIAALPLRELGYLAEMENNYPEALRCYEEDLFLLEDIGAPPLGSFAYEELGRLYRKMMKFDQAVAAHMEFIRLWSRMGGRERLADGLAYVAIDRYAQACAGLEQSGSKQIWMDVLTRVTMLMATVEKLRTLNYEMTDQDLVLYQQAQETARRELGERAFQSAWEEGLAMSVDEAVEFAAGSDLETISLP